MPFSSLLTFLILKSALSDIIQLLLLSFDYVDVVYFFLHPFTFYTMCFLYLKEGSCRQHMVGNLCFLIHFNNLHLLSDKFKPLIFKVIIDIFTLFLFSVCCSCAFFSFLKSKVKLYSNFFLYKKNYRTPLWGLLAQVSPPFLPFLV